MKDKKRKEKKRQRGRSVQELMGIYGFTRYGLATTAGELLFFRVSPVNISVLSASNIDVKIQMHCLLLVKCCIIVMYAVKNA